MLIGAVRRSGWRRWPPAIHLQRRRRAFDACKDHLPVRVHRCALGRTTPVCHVGYAVLPTTSCRAALGCVIG